MRLSRIYLVIGVILIFVSIGLFWGQGYYWDFPRSLAISFAVAGGLLMSASANNWSNN